MSLREYRDGLREQWVRSSTAPTRTIVYTRSSDSAAFTLNAFVTGEDLNKPIPADKTVNTVMFSGLKLEQSPTKTDTVLFDGKVYTVREWKRLGTLFTVSAENTKRNAVNKYAKGFQSGTG